MRWKKAPILLLLLAITVLSGCVSLPQSPKLNTRGTATSTPFQPVSTFTATLEVPPTPLPTETPRPTPSPTGLALTPSSTPAGTTTAVTPSPTLEPSLTPTAAPSATPAPTQSSGGSDPVVKVSVTTNCRTGPGVGYTRISSLTPGKQAQIVGRNPLYPYWVIRDPWGSGRSCWLWDYYASAQGNTSDVPVVDPPASQTPLPSETLTATATPAPGQPSHTPRPATQTNTPMPPTATLPVTPGTPTDTPIPAPTSTDTPVPPPSPTPDSPFCSYTSILYEDEQKILNKINRARREHGLHELQVDSRLVRAARDHGRDMTCNNMGGHDSSDGTKAWVRIARALGHGDNWCYNNWACTEIWSGHGSPSSAFYWWMNHESQDPNYEDNIHKRMILHERMTHLGVGAIYYNDGSRVKIFYTVDFARP